MCDLLLSTVLLMLICLIILLALLLISGTVLELNFVSGTYLRSNIDVNRIQSCSLGKCMQYLVLIA